MFDRELEKRASRSIIEDPKVDIWRVEASSAAKNTRNFIREIVDNLDLQPNPDKPVIALSIGDPTVYGNLKAADETIDAVKAVVEEGLFNGYVPSTGHQDAKEAVAEYLSNDGVEVSPKDVILCSGCSSSLEHCITALADGSKNHNILIPRPGFPIYRTLAEHIGVEARYYNLIPENNWEADIDHLESQIDKNTAAIVLNNPSNPCGSSFSKEHLRNILEVAYNNRIPVIADEIYENLVFPGEQFTSTASLNSGVPILICGGLAKRFLIPGWRLGWIIVHDEFGVLDDIRKALNSLSQRIIGSNTLIQGALPAILRNTPQSFFDSLTNTLALNAKVAFEELKNARGLTPFMPQGTMYMLVEIQMAKFPMFENGLEFAKKMMEEESVFCLPGDCFAIPGFLRLVITVPEELIREACQRMTEFCNRYYTH
ncbi:tyrosine aminotransferase-like [Diabrotica virgifera virgifera]|uniref:Tyrosine aminotransferase n=1 Tax=Diabrotica virgifera virgifera TaxID=50390 RepID=A0A6P7G9Q5_DIAVI|nr:tyrosine aminotransferase-like [Diabrotica virgifera virgifera]